MAEKVIDILNMSDEDFAKAGSPSSFGSEEEPEKKEGQETEIIEEEQEAEITDPPVDPPAAQESQEEEEEELEGEQETDPPVEKKKEEEPPPKKEDPAEQQPDYKATHDRIFAPFKANGKDIQVDNVEDAIQLMQMGANYNVKMAKIKPALKVVKMLERENLMDEHKLNFLIDIHNKKPGAITQLLKDSKIDPVEVDVNTDDTYTPENHTVPDTELELDEVLENMSQTPTYHKTLNVITKEWDQKSQMTLTQNPAAIAEINQHMGNGIFDQVYAVVTKEKSLGKLAGISDLDAYYMIGKRMADQGQLSGQPQVPTPEPPVSPEPKPESAKEKERKAAKQSAKPSPGSTTPTKPKANFLDMSDEEFAKMGKPRFKEV